MARISLPQEIRKAAEKVVNSILMGEIEEGITIQLIDVGGSGASKYGRFGRSETIKSTANFFCGGHG
jgi:hypothetical protein